MSVTDEFVREPKLPHQCFEQIDNENRCPATAMLGEYFCHKHRMKPSPIYCHPKDGFELPSLEDYDSIQKATSEIASRIAYNELDNKRAGLLLYACQVAAANLEAKHRAQAREANAKAQAPTVESPATEAGAPYLESEMWVSPQPAPCVNPSGEGLSEAERKAVEQSSIPTHRDETAMNGAPDLVEVRVKARSEMRVPPLCCASVGMTRVGGEARNCGVEASQE